MTALGKSSGDAAAAAVGKKRHGGGVKGLFRRYWLALVIGALLAVLAASQLLQL